MEGFGCSPIKRVRELGSQKTNIKYKRMKKTKINLINKGNAFNISSDLHSILIGIMLGDGSLYRSSPTSNARLEMSFGQNYEEFALHLGDLFKDYMSNPVKSLEIKGKNNSYKNFRLKTKTLPMFTYYHDLFYKYNSELNKYVKIIPRNIEDFMNPIVLAYLIMTDGNFDKGRNRVRIYTNSFKKDEVENLAGLPAIYNKLGIYAGVLHDRNDQWIITIGAKYLNLLRDTVSPHFHNSMLYRIGIS